VSDGFLKLEQSDYDDLIVLRQADQLSGISNRRSATTDRGFIRTTKLNPTIRTLKDQCAPLIRWFSNGTHESETLTFVQCFRAFLISSPASRGSCFPAHGPLLEKVLIIKSCHQLSYSFHFFSHHVHSYTITSQVL
jgi:hypothetical protein